MPGPLVLGFTFKYSCVNIFIQLMIFYIRLLHIVCLFLFVLSSESHTKFFLLNLQTLRKIDHLL
jgi:hypothetical protein